MSDMLEDYVLDARWARRSFDRAAQGYDAAAELQARVGKDLLGRLELMAITPAAVLDAGAGTGLSSRALKDRYPKALVVALDSSAQMLRVATRRQGVLRRFARVHGDAHQLPLADGSVDLIVSNLLLHWCELDAVLAEFRRVLAPRGLLCFSTLGPDTLRELRSAWAQVDATPHVHAFLDMHDVGDAVVRAGLSSPVLDVERFALSYADFGRVAADLRAAGARNATAGRRRGLSGTRRFAAMQSAYEAFRQDGRLPATYEVVFGHAWAPQAVRGGSFEAASVSLADMKQQLKTRRR